MSFRTLIEHHPESNERDERYEVGGYALHAARVVGGDGLMPRVERLRFD
jgi:hypothetical protein